MFYVMFTIKKILQGLQNVATEAFCYSFSSFYTALYNTQSPLSWLFKTQRNILRDGENSRNFDNSWD